MPKTLIDYSNTVIYKITCNDTSIKDVYVGHTTNFVQRKYAHKQNCINSKSTNHKCKLYSIIRANGGWTNWTIEIVQIFNCNDHYEARIKEQEYFILLNATLNSIETMPKPKPAVIRTPENIMEQGNNSVVDKELLMTILKQNADIMKENSELKNMMADMQQQIMEINKNKGVSKKKLAMKD